MPFDSAFAITYFSEEKILNLIVMIIGIISLAFALIFLLIIKYSFFKGMAIPFLIFGILQVTAGSTVYVRTTKNAIKVEQGFNTDPVKTKLSEIPGTEHTIKNFHLYQCVEILFIITGLIFYLKFRKPAFAFWKGLGLGLLLQCSIALTIDVVAGKKVENYLQHLKML